MDAVTIEIIKVVTTSVVTIGGWWAVHRFTLGREEAARSTVEEQKRIADQRFRGDQQIAELYEPLLGLVEMVETIYFNRQKLVSKLTGNGDSSKAAVDQAEAKRYYFDKSFRPLHFEIISLLQTKRHLLLDAKMPESFKLYLKHAEQDLSLFDFWKEKGINEPYPVDRVRWPRDFKADIQKSLQNLHDTSKSLEEQIQRRTATTQRTTK